MRIANQAGRLVLVVAGGTVDVERRSGGAFGSDPQAVYDRWADFRRFAATVGEEADGLLREDELGAPAPRPRQVFAIGLNYRDHAVEANLALPERPMVFTKFASAITGPVGDIVMPEGFVDFETELVVVIGERASHVTVDEAWRFVAGLTGGQDVSERVLQTSGPPPQQFSLGKSFAGFAPMGPSLVTPDELPDPDDLALGCTVNGETMQASRTAEMVFSVPQIIAFLSSVVTLLPGDVIFTGTPAGVGWARKPRRPLAPGDVLDTEFEHIGRMRHRFVAAATRKDPP